MDMNPENQHTFTHYHLNEKQFEIIKHLVYQRFGIYLTAEKRMMVEMRLGKILRRYRFKSFQEFLHTLSHNDAEGTMLSELINQITTNHTFFYRESAHFEYMTSTALPEIIQTITNKNLPKDIRIWSAGCATGEESYTLAMMLREYLGSQYNVWKAGILATDISEKALLTARAGMYHKERLGQLPTVLLNKYFSAAKNDYWQVHEILKKEVVFRRFNLVNTHYPFQKKFHIIFCRNVMIYFDKVTRDNLIRQFYNWLEPSGYLFIGHSESLGNDNTLFQSVQPAAYKTRNNTK